MMCETRKGMMRTTYPMQYAAIFMDIQTAR
jgi:hypothetical protein